MLILQHEEVQNVKWASKGEIFNLIKNGDFIPYYDSLIHLIFDCQRQRGTNTRIENLI